jgi:hypothetical protein
VKSPAIEYFNLSVEAIPSVKPVAATIAPDLPARCDFMLFEPVKDGRRRYGMSIHHYSIL